MYSFSYFSSKDSLNVFGFRSRLKKTKHSINFIHDNIYTTICCVLYKLNTSFLHSVFEYIPVIYSQMELMENKSIS